MLQSTSLTFWNQQVPTLEELRSKRNMKRVKSKFTVALIGKTYPLRLHAIEKLTKIGKVDVFGTSVRKVKSNPGRIVSRYKFCLCFGHILRVIHPFNNLPAYPFGPVKNKTSFAKFIFIYF